MKRKSFLLSVLAVLLCLSLVLVGCGGNSDGDDDGDDGAKVESAEDKQVIIDALSSKSLSDLLDLESITSETMPTITEEDVVEIIRGFSFETNMTANFEGENGTIYVGIDDGYVKATAGSGNEAWGKFTDDGTFILYNKNGSTFEEVDRMYFISQMIQMIGNNPLDMVVVGAGSNAVDTIMGFELPEMSADDLKLEGDYYVIQDSYYENLVDAAVDMFVEVAEEMGEAPTDEEIDETVDMFNEVIDALGLQIGFEVSGENIIGYLVAVDVDMEALQNIDGFGGQVGPEDEGAYMSASENVCEIKVEISLDSSATVLKSMDVYADIVSEGYTIVKMDADVKVSDMKVEINVNNFELDGITFEGSLGIELLTSNEGDPVGLELTLDAEVGGDYDMDLEGTLYVNVANLSEAGSKLLELDFTYKADGETLTVTADADVTASGKFNFNFACKANGDTLVSASGNANINSADLGTIPSVIKNAE